MCLAWRDREWSWAKNDLPTFAVKQYALARPSVKSFLARLRSLYLSCEALENQNFEPDYLSLSHWHKKMSSMIVLVMVIACLNLLLVKWSSRTTKTFAARRLSLCVNVHGFTSLVVPNPSWNPWSHRFKCPFGITFWRKKCHMLAKKRHLSLTNKIKLYIYIYILGSKNIYLNFFSPHPKENKTELKHYKFLILILLCIVVLINY